MLSKLRESTIKNYSVVLFREFLSEVLSLTRGVPAYLRSNDLNFKNDDWSKLSSYFKKIEEHQTPDFPKLVLLDDFPIYRWIIPNSLLAHKVARELKALVCIFSFRRISITNKRIYHTLRIDNHLRIKLTIKDWLAHYDEYRNLIKYLKHNGNLINYRIDDVPIGLDMYESILRLGFPTVDLTNQQTYRIILLGLKQYIFFKKLFKQERIGAVLVSHDNYIGPGLLAHMAFQFKVRVIIANLLSMTIPTREFQLYEYFRDYESYAKYLEPQILEEGINWAKLQLTKRIGGQIGVDIQYQVLSAFGDEFIERQTAISEKEKILILTHDFFDNPHGYSRMTFNDFYEWLVFVGEISLETNYEWFIKTHRDYSAIESRILDKFLERFTNIVRLDPEVTFQQLKAEGIEYALTCYGTVGHELPLLGFTVINSSYNPHISFNFNVNPTNRDEYEHILRNITRYRLDLSDLTDVYKFYFIHHKVVQNDVFLGISLTDLDRHSGGVLNSENELMYLVTHIESIAKFAHDQLDSMQETGRVYSFEGFLPFERQKKIEY